MRTRPANFWHRLKEISMFFEGRDKVHKTMRRLVKKLEKAGIAYVLLGGMAVNAHGHERTTKDVDVLVTPEGLEEFKRRYVPKDYGTVPGRPRRFADGLNGVTVDFLITGRFPGSGRPGPVPFPDPNRVAETIKEIKVVDLVTLIQLKLAARRHQDFADVVNLIGPHNLDETFADKLHPSLRRDYMECLEEKRREDAYESREGEPPPGQNEAPDSGF
jgi:hypothetical protein